MEWVRGFRNVLPLMGNCLMKVMIIKAFVKRTILSIETYSK